ncbi:MAG TPA: hypothetical protein VI757_00045 [Bacteroidia bacterium]|nr:hypothetical protein [Bacteroidia bacterium]
MRNTFSFSLKCVFFFLLTAFLFSSCSQVHYTYYKKHKVPYSAPEEIRLAKAIPVKPFLTETETTLKESPAQIKNETAKKSVAKNSDKTNVVSRPESQKIASDFDINKFFREHKLEIKKKGGEGMLDDRTTIIILLVILILVLLALIGDGLLWLLWLALLVLLILALIKYLGLFG